jgi:hypothetical protein
MITHVKFVGVPTGDQERALRFCGVEVSEPQQQPWGTFATLKDPDGNQLVLSSS